MNKQILRLAIPNIISNITVPLLGMVDLAILGHLESEAYIGAVALAGLIFNFIYALFSFLRMGTSGFTAQAFGENNRQEMILMLGRSLLFAITGGLLIILLQVPIEIFSFYLLDGSPETEKLAAEYYRIRIYAAPASLCILALTGWYTGMQNARYPMIIAIFINLVNVVASLFFVYRLGMKSAGVAWGTLIAQYAGLILGLALFFRKFSYLLVYRTRIGLFDSSRLKRFFQVNTDIIIRTLCLIFTFAFFTAQSAKINDTVLAVNTVLLQYLFLFSYLTDGFAYAAEALVGKFTGAGNAQSLKKVIRLLFFWGILISIPFSLSYFIGGDRLLLLLTDNREVIREASPYLFWVGLVPLVSFAAFIWDGVYIGATASQAMRNTLLISTLLVFLPAYYIFHTPFGNHGLWLAMILFMLSRGLLLTFYSRKSIISLIKPI